MNPDPSQNNANPTTRRRSSGWMPAFEGLTQQRHDSNNAARRASMTDQQAKGGIFHQFFHNNFGRNAGK